MLKVQVCPTRQAGATLSVVPALAELLIKTGRYARVEPEPAAPQPRAEPRPPAPSGHKEPQTTTPKPKRQYKRRDMKAEE